MEKTPTRGRPTHTHFWMMGPSLGSRLVTADVLRRRSLLPFDPIFDSAPEHTRHRMLAHNDHDGTEENWAALSRRWDIVDERQSRHTVGCGGGMTDFGETPSQTVGPYFSMRLSGEDENVLTARDERIVIEGKVTDGAGNHIEDALLEIWQAGPSGRYRHPDDTRDLDLEDDFTGFGRTSSDFETGEYRFETLKPGRVPDAEGAFQAPHISVIVQGRGMLNPTFTRIYFSDEAEANTDDLVLRGVPESRRHTLIAQLQGGTKPAVYRFDIRMQGDDETVFFDF